MKSKKHRRRFNEMYDEEIVELIEKCSNYLKEYPKSYSHKNTMIKATNELVRRQYKLMRLRSGKDK